jgi:hypothetical protein
MFVWLLALANAEEDDPAEEIVVWGDLFARWDDTRWFVSTESVLPYELKLKRDENTEFETNQVLFQTVIACDKEWKLGKRRYEVACRIEDFAMRAAIAEDVVSEKDVARAQLVLDQVDAKLTDATLSLQVAADGRVVNLGLDGVPRDNERESDIHETLRQVLSRAVVGFNLKMQRYNQLHEGKWAEYNSTVMSMRPGTPGSSMLVHHLNRYRGHVLVQSIGKGVTSLGGDTGTVNYELDFIGVSTFDDVEGFMTERVWALAGTSTASAFFDQGSYANMGRITMLGTDDRPDCGPSRVMNGRTQSYPFLPRWIPHDS